MIWCDVEKAFFPYTANLALEMKSETKLISLEEMSDSSLCIPTLQIIIANWCMMWKRAHKDERLYPSVCCSSMTLLFPGAVWRQGVRNICTYVTNGACSLATAKARVQTWYKEQPVERKRAWSQHVSFPMKGNEHKVVRKSNMACTNFCFKKNCSSYH